MSRGLITLTCCGMIDFEMEKLKAISFGIDVDDITSVKDVISAVSEIMSGSVWAFVTQVPDEEYLSVIRRISEGSDVYIVTLCDDLELQRKAYQAGADIVVPDPSLIPEALGAISRRGTVNVLDGEYLQFSDISLSTEHHAVWRGDKEIFLTPKEFSLLRYFLLHPKTILSQDDILREVWGLADPSSNVVENAVSRLRKKLGEPVVIRTVQGLGYILRTTF